VLIGQGAGASITSILGFTPPTGSDALRARGRRAATFPTLANSAATR